MSVRTRSPRAPGKGDNRHDNFPAFRGSAYWDLPQWWGYLHSNGTIQCKRWHGDVADYTTDCEGNDFVEQVVEPFRAATFEQAQDYIKAKLGL